MSRFVLTAQLQLQSPNNTRDVIRDIERQLGGGLDIPINLGDRNTPRQINDLNRRVNDLNRSGRDLSRTFGLSIRRFAGFTVASRAVSLFTNKLAGGFAEAIKFERELVKIAQVTGKTVQQLDGLTKTITNLSTSLGVASQELVGTTRILAQAGIKANDLEVALAALAKTTLAPTFEDITKTAEGAVAILAQFGQGVGALEDQLGSINKVAGQFAVESGDLISAVRRFGGVFKSAGGELEDLLGLFTSVRATTRESAESIATGLRTIFTRIQRPKTIEFLRQFGVELTDLEGKFVGPFEAVRQLSAAFAGLEEGDIRFVQVAEELGGFRQIGKVIPLIQQFTVAEQARQAALQGRGSLDEDAAKAQQALAVQFEKVKEEFFALVRGISETGTFQTLIKSTLALTSNLIALADAFKPLLPLLAGFAAIKIGANIGNIARGIGAGFVGRNQGGPIPFATGGVVPGTGNRDTVPAMLTPGEFVIRKSSVNKLGVGTLAAMNENRFATGDEVVPLTDFSPASINSATRGQLEAALKTPGLSGTREAAIRQRLRQLPPGAAGEAPPPTLRGIDLNAPFGVSFLEGRGDIKQTVAKVFKDTAPKEGTAALNAALEASPLKAPFKKIPKNQILKGAKVNAPNAISTELQPKGKEIFQDDIVDGIPRLFANAVSSLRGTPFGIDKQLPLNSLVSNSAVGSLKGQFFEAFVRSVTGVGLKDTNAADTIFDFQADELANAKSDLAQLFGPGSFDFPNEFKNSYNADNVASSIRKGATLGDIEVFTANKGGTPSGSDTVPALLTPGEFVINKKAAKQIGSANLNRMNKQGVVGFNKGGSVGGIQRFAEGGGVAGGLKSFAGIAALQALPGIVSNLTESSDKTEKSLKELEASGFNAGEAFSKLINIITTTGIALAAFGVQLNAQGIRNFVGGLKNFRGNLGGIAKGQGIGGRAGFNQTLSAGAARTNAAERLRELRKQKKARLDSGNPFVADINTDIDAVRRRGRAAGRAGGKSTLGRLGGRLRGAQLRGGLTGKAASGAVKGLLKLGPTALKLGAGLARLATGPVGLITTGLGIFSSVLKAGFGVQEKLNKAIEEGNTARAKELAAINNLSGIEQAFSGIPVVGGYITDFGNFIRGTSTEAEKNKAEVAALAARADRDKADNAKKASEALADVASGSLSITKAFKGGALTKSISQAFQANEATRNVNFEQEQLKSTGGSAALRNILTLGGLLGESAGEKNKRIDAENAARAEENQKRFNDAYNELLPAIRQQARASISAGQSFADFENTITNNGKDFQLTAEQAQQLEKEFINLKQAAIDNRIAFLSLNLGLDPLIQAQKGLSVEIGNLAAAAQGSFDPVASAATTLEAAINGANISDGAFDQAIKVATSTLGNLGASQGQIDQAVNSISAFRAASDGADDALRQLQKDFKGSDASPEQIKEALLNQISSVGGLGKEASQLLKDSLRGLELSDEDIQAIISGGDISGIVDKVRETGGESVGQLVELFDEYGNAQKELLKITDARIQKEGQLIAAITAQEDAAKTLAEFTGKEFGARQRSSFAEDRFRVATGGAGTTPTQLRADIARRRAETSAAGGRVNAEGQFEQTAEQQQTQQENLRQDQATVQFTKEKLAIIREEINVLKNKLALEKEAAQALLANDIEAFAENINASIAASAFRTGDTQTLRDIGGEAAAAGFASLTDEEKQASRGQLEALGISSGLADAAAGTSPEIEALKAEGVAYAEALVAATDNTAEYAQAQLTLVGDLQTAAEATIAEKEKEIAKIQESNEARDAEIARLKEQAEQERESTKERREQLSGGGGNLTNSQAFQDATRQSRGMWGAFFSNIGNIFGADENRVSYSTGGTVYASRGMFIPRGTDTVPAMLTPGEFVVNRAAVQRGNNLQILRSMNGGDTAPNGSPAAMSKGGSVGYYNQGGEVAGGMGEFVQGFTQAISQLGGAFGTFSQSVQQLAQMKLSVDLAPTRVDVNVIGPMLSELTEATKEVVLNAVVSEIQLNQLGQLERTV